MSTRTLEPETTAEAYLELLKDRGIDVFLGNAGTDFASLVEGFARFADEPGRSPRPLVIPHEFVAVSMAHGYYVAGGRPAAVMVHVNVGTGNAATAIITAARANVPLVDRSTERTKAIDVAELRAKLAASGRFGALLDRMIGPALEEQQARQHRERGSSG